MKTYAIDFESYYDKNFGVDQFGPVNYTRKTDIYLVSIVGNDGLQFVGDPLDAPWKEIAGHRWVSHNRTFDRACFEALDPPKTRHPSEWHCTADLCAYIGAPRSLKNACHVLFNVAVDKTIRDNMKGKRWEELDENDRNLVCHYALTDSEWCLKIWEEFGDVWPEHERQLSIHTSDMCLRGIGIDESEVELSLQRLRERRDAIKEQIPWHSETNAKGKPVPLLGTLRFNSECVARGIEKPKTTKKDSEVYAKWLAKHPEMAPIARARNDYRSINRTIEVVKKLRDFSDNGRLYYSLKYGGAHTMRWSGSGGLNVQNFNRDEVFGVNLRNLFIPAPGHEFVNVDFSQIEAIVTLWLAGEKQMLGLVRDGMDLYEAHGRVCGLYSDPRPMKEVDPNLRQLCKARVLALGFGVGARQFINMAWVLARVRLSPIESKRNVNHYRRTNPEIRGLWTRLQKDFQRCRGGDFFLQLPSGRELHYYDVGSGKARYVLGEREFYVHPGLLTENYVQATARDLLGASILRVEAAGYPVVLHTHDEILAEVPKGTGEKALVEISDLMTAIRDETAWAEGLPVRVEGKVTNRYEK